MGYPFGFVLLPCSWMERLPLTASPIQAAASWRMQAVGAKDSRDNKKI